VLKFAVQSVEALREELPPPLRNRIEGLGIACPFQLWNWAQALGVAPEDMADWQTRDLRQELDDRLPLPVSLQNDATAAASAALVFGEAQRGGAILSLYIGFFIGGGVVMNGHVFAGATGNAGAIGSMPVLDQAGQPRQLIDLASLAGLEARLRAEGQDPEALWGDPEDWTFPASALSGWGAEAAPAIAQAIRAAMALIDFEEVQIEGWLPQVLCQDLVQEVFRELAGLDFRGLDRPRVTQGPIGPDARALGAASQPLSARFMTGVGEAV
jgi:predicted NBD/HSP70 family sugar kinase